MRAFILGRVLLLILAITAIQCPLWAEEVKRLGNVSMSIESARLTDKALEIGVVIQNKSDFDLVLPPFRFPSVLWHFRHETTFVKSETAYLPRVTAIVAKDCIILRSKATRRVKAVLWRSAAGGIEWAGMIFFVKPGDTAQLFAKGFQGEPIRTGTSRVGKTPEAAFEEVPWQGSVESESVLVK